MEILERPLTKKLPAERFTGDAWAEAVYRGQGSARARANLVRFAPGARTGWHTHGHGQALYIVEGVALIQSRGGHIVEAHAGQIVWTPPGEPHWHGAGPDRFMTHLGMWENDEFSWHEHVTDEQYTGPRTRA